jgi:hypothetical protein
MAPDGGWSTGRLGRYRLDWVPVRYLARVGDVLFRSRGDRNTATALTEEMDYVAWYINQAAAQRYFDLHAQGGSLRMISVGCLADLEVPLPSLAAQRAIAEIGQLAREELALSRRLAERRRQLTDLTLLLRRAQSMNGGRK